MRQTCSERRAACSRLARCAIHRACSGRLRSELSVRCSALRSSVSLYKPKCAQHLLSTDMLLLCKSRSYDSVTLTMIEIPSSACADTCNVMCTLFRYAADSHSWTMQYTFHVLTHSFSCPQPEFLSDVQKCSKAVYMRTTEAAQCNVRSVLLLPLFGAPQRSTTIGVVEVAQSTDKMPFDNVVTALSVALRASHSPTWLGAAHRLRFWSIVACCIVPAAYGLQLKLCDLHMACHHSDGIASAFVTAPELAFDSGHAFVPDCFESTAVQSVTCRCICAQDCNLYLCEAAALQKEMEMALIMNVAALKLCCKESKEDACAKQECRPWPDPAPGARLATITALRGSIRSPLSS